MRGALLIDFGSTFTKIVAVDIEEAVILGQAQAPTTVDTDITVGLQRGLQELAMTVPPSCMQFQYRFACSSAAGGLRMVVIGLIPDLTAEAARRAALGAGAKVLGCLSGVLSRREMEDLERLRPDIILLAGGTDGGNTEVVLRNARLLAGSSLAVPVVMAGNKDAADEVEAVFRNAGREVYVTENVLPQLDRLNVEPARQAIREVFLRHIVKAKGLDRVASFVDEVVMPTPAAVMKAVELLARGTLHQTGLGDLMVVDVGGATTDVYSIARGEPTQSNVVRKGLPEPYAKRTVEGDLGLRYSARTLWEAAGRQLLLEHLEGSGLSFAALEEYVNQVSRDVGRQPIQEAELVLDGVLGRVAVDVAFERHVGRIQEVYSPMGRSFVQYGKDLTAVATVIGTGGVFAYNRHCNRILAACRFKAVTPDVLKPKNPKFYVDERYVFAAMGLLSQIDCEVAFKICCESIRPALEG